jgi:allantoate deiminase
MRSSRIKTETAVNAEMVPGAERIMARIDKLASFSAMDGGVLRAYLTPEHQAAHAQLAAWMVQAGLEVWQDAAGNQWGRKVARHPTRPALIIGSHSDTVVDAGKYDGTLGVLMAIEALARLRDVALPYHVDVVAFADEEGTRFNTTLLVSGAVAGAWQPERLTITDSHGISMEQAFTQFGLEPMQVGQAQRDPQSVMAYLEVHIEQGPVLESLDLPVGVVTAIAGAKRFLFTVDGQAGHAGTVPVHLRQDALCAAAEMITHIETFAKQNELVATVGRCDVAHGTVNVIPGQVVFSLDIRSQDQDLLDRSSKQLASELEQIAKRRHVQLAKEQIYEAGAVPCNDKILQQWARIVAEETGQPVKLLASGAGHDAMIMAKLTEIGMLFVRCEQGISHHPAENVMTEDVRVALSCFEQMITSFTD